MRAAKELMTTSVPNAHPDETVGVALERLREYKPEEASHLYLIDEASVLTGQVPIERFIAAAPETRLDGGEGAARRAHSSRVRSSRNNGRD